MSDDPPFDDQPAEDSLSDRIDQICDRFEADLRNRSAPRIEDFVELVGASGRDRLLCELVAIEFELTRRTCHVDFADYLNRFPQSLSALSKLRDELESPSPDQEETRCAPWAKAPTSETPLPRKPPTGRFQSPQFVGRGGFGTVWKALDLVMQREVAVKIPHSLQVTAKDLSEVLREAQAAAELRHPNIVFVHEVNEQDGIPFIVTDYIDGKNLKEFQETNPMTPRQAVTIVHKLALAIQHAHHRGVVHRDLKLTNIIMDQSGEPHLADFGLAKREGRPDLLAIESQVLGTPAYMAPEQARADHAAVDRQTDVYSLGVILFELLTGRLPFQGEQQLVLQQVIATPPPTLRSLKPNIPKDLESACLKCLEKDKTRRYSTAKDLAEDLERFLLDVPLRGVPVAWQSRVRKWTRRNRIRILNLTASMLVGIGLIAAAWWWSIPAPLKQRVLFETDPPGCEITTVFLDATTGEPDPGTIATASGRTPLHAWRVPGDYLVIAALSDNRFHEVLRHVPDATETTKLIAPHRYWRRDKSGAISFRWPIRIPETEPHNGMRFIQRATNWTPGSTEGSSLENHNDWDIPAFYVDPQEHILTETTLEGSCRVKGSRFSDAVAYAECVGKRLPSYRELQYLCDSFRNKELHEPLAEENPIRGLDSLPWEWTTTKLSDLAHQQNNLTMTDSIPCRLVLAGTSPIILNGSKSTLAHIPHLLSQEAMDLPTHAVRCVRSPHPRRSPKDFPRRVSPN